MYPFEQFTERAKNVLTLAQEEAERSHHSYIGTEHLLLGLLRREEGMAAKVLNSLGVEIGGVRSTVESVLGRNERLVIHTIVPTNRVKKVIELAFEEARWMGTDHVGTEHLLLGLLVEGEGIAAHVLTELGASLEKVRAEIDRLHHEMPPAGPVPEHATGPGGAGPWLGPPSHIGTGRFSGHLVTARFGRRPRSGSDEIQLAAERLAAEQCTVVGVEHALLAGLDTDPLVRRLFAALGIDEARIAEARRIATPPERLVELRREYQTKVAQLEGWRELPSQPGTVLHHFEGRGSSRPLSQVELTEELGRLRTDLEEAERRWRAGEAPAAGESGPGKAAP